MAEWNAYYRNEDEEDEQEEGEQSGGEMKTATLCCLHYCAKVLTQHSFIYILLPNRQNLVESKKYTNDYNLTGDSQRIISRKSKVLCHI